MTKAYLYAVMNYDDEWKVFKNGTGKDARAVETHQTKRPALNAATRLASGNAHAVVVNTTENDFTRLEPHTAAPTVYENLKLDLRWVEYGQEPGWWLSFWGSAERSFARFGRKKKAVQIGEDVMELVGAHRFVIRHQNGGRKSKYNPSLERSEIPF